MNFFIQYGTTWNSFWSHCHEVVTSLTEQGHTVFFLEPLKVEAPQYIHLKDAQRYPEPPGLRIIRSKVVHKTMDVLYWIRSEIRALKELRKLCRDMDVFITYQVPMGLLPLLWARMKRKRIVFMFVDDYSLLAARFLSKFYIRCFQPCFVKVADRTVCTSKALHERALRYSDSVWYITNGIRSSLLRDPEKTKKPDSPKPVIGFVGILGNWVDIDFFVEAAKGLEGAEVWVVGDGDKLPQLRRRIAEEALTNLKTFGLVSREEVFGYIRCFTVAAIPFHVNSLTDSVSPLKLFEYWYMKKCVLAPRTAELSQYEGKLLFYRDNKEAVKIIKDIIHDEERLGSYGELGYGELDSHDWDGRMGAEMKKVLTEWP